MLEEFVDDGSGKVKGINIVCVEWIKFVSGGWDMKKVEGFQQFFFVDFVFLFMGFLGFEVCVLGDEIEKDVCKNVKIFVGKYSINVEGVFVVGDCCCGQLFIVWGINEGCQVVCEVDLYFEKNISLFVIGGIVKRIVEEVFIVIV